MSDELQNLPVLPLRDIVIFPGVSVPIGAGRPVSIKGIETALAADQRVLAVTQRDGKGDATPDNLFTFGTIARVEQVQRGPSGMQLLLHGEERGIVVRMREHEERLDAVVRAVDELQPVQPDDSAFLALNRELRERAAELGRQVGMPDQSVQQIVDAVDDPGRFADFVAAYVEVSAGEKQELLEMLPVEERLRRVLLHVEHQLSVLEAQADIQSEVQRKLGDRQREVVLREQLAAIQRELGEGDDDASLDELRQRLAEIELPDDARTEVDRELARLTRLGKDSMESQVIRTFLETVAELPWNEHSDESIDLAEAERILDADHHGLADVKDRVLEFLAVRELQSHATDPDERMRSRGPILLFAGPPGVGKTSIAKSIARAMGREYVRVSLGGARDQADITGHRRTYVGAMPGRIIQGMRQAGTKNPVFLLDEIDKLGVSHQGDPAAALLEVLDPAQNDTFTDHYLGLPFDLSEVVFIATANYLENIPGPLRDRMEVVDFAGYTEAEKLAIAREYLLPRQLEDNFVGTHQVEVEDSALRHLISGYTREAGVRQLEREIGRLVRKAARVIASGTDATVRVDADTVGEMLGRPKVHPEEAAECDSIGVATGMFYTPVGGDIMFVEATKMPGRGKLTLTGQLGDVMRESAEAAWSWARTHARALHIDGDTLDHDLHVHVPAGAIPKDGPSAGVAMASTIVSSLADRPLRADIAMTGEITLSGRVLPIGGVKEKLLGGVRAGIREFVLPRRNERDLEDLPQEVRDSITVHFCEELGEVLALTLRDASWRHGRLLFGDEDPESVEPLSLRCGGGRRAG